MTNRAAMNQRIARGSRWVGASGRCMSGRGSVARRVRARGAPHATIGPMHGPAADSLLAALDPAQQAAVTRVRGPLCILAGAGTGKTRVLTRRVAYALATGAVRPVD